MPRRFALIATLALFFFTTKASVSYAAEASRPNIVFIMADDKYN